LFSAPASWAVSRALDAEERRRHLYIVGQTGTGKSTLLLNLVAQTSPPAKASRYSTRTAILPSAALMHVPRDRTNDICLRQPGRCRRPIGFNPLSAVAR